MNDEAQEAAEAPELVEAEEPKPRKPRARKQAAQSAPVVYRVAEGKAITTRRGIRSEGETVTAKDFADGQERLDTLVSRGVVVES
jgi:hypothetical protein